MKGVAAIVVTGVLWAAVALAADPVAVITEINLDGGGVDVRQTGDTAWRPVAPLQALRPGDQVRATGASRAVLIVMGWPDPHTVTHANSPFTVSVPGSHTLSARARTALGGVTDFLFGQQRRRSFPALAVRSARAQPVMLAPRATKVLPVPPTFEWSGPDTRYTLRVLGPTGLMWERPGLAPAPLTYPTDAPALRPGARYTWELEGAGTIQRAHFEVATAAEWTAVREGLAELDVALRASYPAATAALLRAVLLLKEGLYADARRELMAAIASSPAEPTLHALLAEVYGRTGLSQLASEEADEADRLAKRP